MRSLLFTLFGSLFIIGASAQYVTPGQNVSWNLDSLVLHSNGAVVAGEDINLYNIFQNIVIAETDTLKIDTTVIVYIDSEVLIEIEGAFHVEPPVEALFTAMDSSAVYEGFRFAENSNVVLKRAIFEYGGGLKCITPNFLMENCIVRNNDLGVNTGGALEISNGRPMIVNNDFIHNARAAISSGANVEVAPRILNNNFEGNNTTNSNRPQINVGPSGPADTTFIIGNNILGDPALEQAGGIAFSSLLGIEGHVVISDNEITNNRYGIAVTGNGITSRIENNIILDNNTQNDPMLGGSGINLNSTSYNFSVITGNQISGNLWGITLQGNASANLGDTAQANFNPGENIFDNNGNNGDIYALFNNTPNTIMAMNNCWIGSAPATEEEVEDVISHMADDASLGEVFYLPYWDCGTVSSTEDVAQRIFGNIFPNPSRDYINIPVTQPGTFVEIFDIAGKKVFSTTTNQSEEILKIDFSQYPAGLYFVRGQNKQDISTDKFIIQN